VDNYNCQLKVKPNKSLLFFLKVQKFYLEDKKTKKVYFPLTEWINSSMVVGFKPNLSTVKFSSNV